MKRRHSSRSPHHPACTGLGHATRADVEHLSNRLDDVSKRVDDVSKRVDDVSQRVDTMSDRIDARFVRIDATLTTVVESLARLEERVSQCAPRSWVLNGIIIFLVGTITTMWST
jgi:ABC-type transporter Mla subunit MlaD